MKQTPYWKTFLAASIAALGVAAAPVVLAEPGRHGERCHAEDGAGPRHDGHGRHGERGQHFGPQHEALPPFLRGIELSEPQRDKLFALFHAQAPQQRELMKQVRQSRDALHQLTLGDGFDAKRARELADRHARAVGDLAFAHADLDAKAMALLSPEQRKALDEKREEMRDARADMRRESRDERRGEKRRAPPPPAPGR